jgi:hypothetical protein
MRILALVVIIVSSLSAMAQDKPHPIPGDSMHPESLALTSIFIDQMQSIEIQLKAAGLSNNFSFSRGSMQKGENRTTYKLEIRKCPYSIRNADCELAGTLTIDESMKENGANPSDFPVDYNYSFNFVREAAVSGTPLFQPTLEIASAIAVNLETIGSTEDVLDGPRFSVTGGAVSYSANGDRDYEFIATNIPHASPEVPSVWAGNLHIYYDHSSKSFAIKFKASGLG